MNGGLDTLRLTAEEALGLLARKEVSGEELHRAFPVYGFDVHKGYCTPMHSARLTEHGPCEEHRWSYANVVAAAQRHGMRSPRAVSSKPGLFDASEGEVVDNEVL